MPWNTICASRAVNRSEGNIAVVTGAESGIGAACAIALAGSGVAIAILYWRDQAAAERTRESIQKIGADAITIPMDVTSEKDVEGAFDRVRSELGTPDILVNSAGLNMTGVAVADMELEQWERIIRTDLTGPFLTCRRFARDLRAGGRPGHVINITSIHATVARAGGADYCAAKGGLQSFTSALALELAPLRINVNAIAPGMILTPMNERAVKDAAYRQALERSIPWARAGTAEEVARVTAFLCSSVADYITGATFTIDGGLSLMLGQGA